MMFDLNDPRNIADKYKHMSEEDIKADLGETRYPLIIACESVNGDFHKANIIRTAEGFNCDSVWIVGNKKWDKRGAVGAYNRIDVRYATELEQVVEFVKPDPYEIVALDNVDGAVPLDNKFDWYPFPTILVVGEEQRGLSQKALDMAHRTAYIPIRGAVRSFSVSTAAGMAMFHYSQQMGP
jgi:tRNA G18 (ribose-2'-O)-methylase SpoU